MTSDSIAISVARLVATGSFSVGALAIAAERANAIGAVRLTLAPDKLEVELLRVGSFSSSFIPGALVEMVRFSVPYLAVRGLVRKDGAICLALDPTVAAPFNRFTLSRFTDAPLEALVGAHRARWRARWASVLLPAPVGALAVYWVPEALASGWAGRLAIAVLAMLISWFAFREVLRWASFGGPISRHYRDAFENRLSARLGIVPAASPDIVDDLPFDPMPLIVARQPLREALRRPFLRTVVGLTLAVVLLTASASLLSEYSGAERFNVPEVPRLVAEGGVSAQADLAGALDLKVPSKYPRCICERADSPLWRDGLPELSLLPSSRHEDSSGRPRSDVAPIADDEDIHHYDFDMAVVNNTNRSLSDIRIVLTFARRSAAGERVGVTDRGLFWEGALGAGRAVKWHVEGPGTEVRIDSDFTDLLASGAAAPADRFFALTRAQQRVVRLHGAMMLAYLGDPRALAATEQLGTLSAVEEQTRDAIVRAAAPLRICGASGEGENLSVCVFNATDKPVPNVSVRERVAGPGEGRNALVEEPVPVHEGLRVPFPIEADEPAPAEFEATVN